MILDTCFLIDVMNGDDEVAELVAELDVTGTPTVASTTVMELWEGIHRAESTEAEREAVRDLLEGLREVPFDKKCAIKAGEISAALADSGQPIDVEDVMIASVALAHDAPVVTRKVSHFESVEGLEVASY